MPHYEPGRYMAVVTRQYFGESSSGTSYFGIEFEPTRATGANSFPDTVYEREVRLWMTEKAAKYSIDKLRYLGYEGGSFYELEPSADGHHTFVGQEIEVECSINDDGYEDWQLSYGGGRESVESNPSIAAKLDNLFGKQLLVSQPAPTPAPAKPKPQRKKPAPIPDEEVPF